MLCEVSIKNGMKEVDYLEDTNMMDDGSVIRLRITIDRKQQSCVFDFNGTSHQTMGNTNCPLSVVYSAILYSLRSMIKSDIPLNNGVLNPIKVVIPENSLLNPENDRAIVGGNVLTS